MRLLDFAVFYGTSRKALSKMGNRGKLFTCSFPYKLFLGIVMPPKFVANVAVIALACLCPASQGQQPRDDRTQKPEDLIAYVKSADGKPVSGVEVKVVFFAGFGTPDISSLTTSS